LHNAWSEPRYISWQWRYGRYSVMKEYETQHGDNITYTEIHIYMAEMGYRLAVTITNWQKVIRTYIIDKYKVNIVSLGPQEQSTLQWFLSGCLKLGHSIVSHFITLKMRVGRRFIIHYLKFHWQVSYENQLTCCKWI